MRAHLGACPAARSASPSTRPRRADRLPEQRKETGGISGFADLASNAEKARQAVWARLSLRKCDEVGALTRVRGRVMVSNAGTIRLGSRVRLWGHPTPIELATLPGGEILVGDGTYVNRGVCVCSADRVRIGRNCALGNDVLILDTDFHAVGHHDQFASDVPRAVMIGDNVWLAARSVVLKGVSIGEGAVVCAGAVVVGSVSPYTVVAGTPARPIRRVTDAERRAAPLPASSASG